MATPRFTLTDQLHFIADAEDRPDVVVTVQHWTKTGTQPGGIYVVCFNGVERTRMVCNDAAGMAGLVTVMAKYKDDHKDHLLSEEAADAHVQRRGGPALTWCHRASSCDAPVPYASAVCGYGHPTESVGKISFESLARKGKVHTLPVSGQRRG